MQYEQLKSPDIERLPFVRLIILQGHETKSIEIEVDGTSYLISSDYSGLKFSQPKPDEIVDKWQVSGTVCGMEIQPKIFDSERDAERAKTDLPTDSDIKVSKIKWNET